MYKICKRFSFSASHRLDPEKLPPDHPCARLHGHNYEIEIELASTALNASSFIRDYRELGIIKDWIDANLDHRHLNDVLDITTAECLAEYIFLFWQNQIPEMVAVRVSETPKTWAEFRK